MNYADIKPNDTANGEGICVSLFVSGCTNYCKGCFTCKKNGGMCIYNDDMQDILKMILQAFINNGNARSKQFQKHQCLTQRKLKV